MFAGEAETERAFVDSSKPTCYLSFPDNAPSAAAAEELRVGLEERGIIVLPPGGGDDVLRSTIRPPFHWLRQSDAVVLDMTGRLHVGRR